MSSGLTKKDNADYVIVGRDSMQRPIYRKRAEACITGQAALFPPREDYSTNTLDVPELEEELLSFADDPSMIWQHEDGPEMLIESVEWATELHEGQTRKSPRGKRDGVPYIEHPLRCSIRLHRLGIRDGNLITAAVLHDTLEDCSDKILGRKVEDPILREKLAYVELAIRTNPEVAQHVWNVSNHPGQSKASKAEKNRIYAEKLCRILTDSPKSFIVKASDLQDNAGGLHHALYPGNEEMVKKLHTKYSHALSELQAHDHHLDSIEGGDAIKDLLSNIRGNLFDLGKRL